MEPSSTTIPSIDFYTTFLSRKSWTKKLTKMTPAIKKLTRGHSPRHTFQVQKLTTFMQQQQLTEKTMTDFQNLNAMLGQSTNFPHSKEFIDPYESAEYATISSLLINPSYDYIDSTENKIWPNLKNLEPIGDITTTSSNFDNQVIKK